MLIDFLRPSVAVTSRSRLLALAIPVLLSTLACAQEYTLTDLGTLGGSSSTSYAVNNAGQVVGSALIAGDGHSEPFLYSKGTMKDAWPGGTEFGGITVAINNSGHFLVNYITDAAGDTESYLWNGISWADLGTGGATGMNDIDSVVGYTSNGYWLYSNSLLNTAPGYSLPLGTVAAAYAINNAGTIVGECETAIPFSPGQNGCIFGPDVSVAMFRADLGGPPDTPYALSSNDETCGSNGVSQFAIWSNTGAETYTTNIGYAAQCNSLDDYGVAVGNGYPSVEGLTNGYIYDPVNKLRDLNTLVHPFFHKGHAISIQNAQSISDTGFIAADCFIGNFVTYQLVAHACLLSPNWARIIRDSFVALTKGDPECIQCKTELLPEVDSLPSSFADLSASEKRKAVATLEKIESHLVTLRDQDRISEAAAVLLSHDTQMALRALGLVRG